MMQSLVSFFTMGVFSMVLFSSPSVSTSFAAFPDSGGREDTKAIEYLYDAEIVEGYTDGTYKPDREINRAEFTKIVLKTAQVPVESCSKTEVGNIGDIFSDVSSGDWFAEYVCSAYMSGFINGYDDGTFRPAEIINLAEAAKIVTLTQGTELNTADTQEWFAKYMDALESEKALNPNLVSGVNSSINRGVMADMVWRLQTGNEVYLNDEPQEITSCMMLETQIEKSQLRNGGGMFGGFETMEMTMLDESMPMPTATGAPTLAKVSVAESEVSSDFSTTNIQENGVDEADVVKNDGSHIFYARGENVKIVRAYPAENMKEDSTITVEGMNVTELFLEQDTLILMGSKNYSGGITPYTSQNRMMVDSSMYYAGGIEVRIFDIADRTNPVQTRSVSLDGNIISSRRVGDILYIVSNNYLYNYSAGDDLPMVRDNTREISIAPECGNISYFPNFTSSNMTTVTAVDTQNPNIKVAMQNFLGAGNEIYSSPENLYIVQSDNEQVFRDEDGVASWGWEDISKISKFSLDGLSVELAAQGTVPGRVLNQYSMSEFEDNFRIATTQSWGNNSENMVFILDEDLKESGSIRNIARGEQIKSVRFMGERGFVVTFKAIDPLFVIDMNPENPEILGELKIPGWSDYLHPIDENYLIGFGKEVNPESENNDRLTWDMLMGMKISIFDVSDLSDPKEIHKTVIGDRGTESEILRNPRALFYDEERQLIGFPVQIQTQVEKPGVCELNSDLTCSEGCLPACEPSICDEESGICTMDCKITCVAEDIPEYEQFENTFSGAQLYQFDVDSGFELQGEISHFPNYSENYWDRNYTVQRLVRIGESMYSMSYGMIKGLDMNLEETSEVSFLGELSCTAIQDQNLCSTRPDCEVNWVQPYCPVGKSCIQVVEFGGCMDAQ